MAIIGAGGMGASNAVKLIGQNIVALADPDFEHVAKAFLDDKGQPNPERVALKPAYDKAAKYADYRRMFDLQKDIDAVVIATPDHHHAVAAAMAMERGIHVYVQKPLTYTVEEGRKLLDLAARKPKLVTQMGNQGHSGDDGRRVVELIRGGVIGKVREVSVWTNRPVWPQGMAKPANMPTPGSLDWDVWLGPAAVDWGYNPDYAHFNWRGWVPFGVGALGDMGAHLIDFPLWALEPGLPTRVETRHSPWGGDTNPWDGRGPDELTSYPLASVTTYSFGNAPGGPLKLTWYDGGLMPPTPEGIPSGYMDPGGGVMFVGDQGRADARDLRIEAGDVRRRRGRTGSGHSRLAPAHPGRDRRPRDELDPRHQGRGGDLVAVRSRGAAQRNDDPRHRRAAGRTADRI